MCKCISQVGEYADFLDRQTHSCSGDGQKHLQDPENPFAKFVVH